MIPLHKKITAILLSVISISCLSSCQNEEEMEGRMLTGVCWEGVLPVKENHGQENYFSRFFFYEENGYKYGYEEVYIKGQYDFTYEFSWYWLDDAYSVAAINYGGRWQSDISCIDITNITNNYIYGYYYIDLADYWAYKDGNTNLRGDNYIELKHVDAPKRQD